MFSNCKIVQFCLFDLKFSRLSISFCSDSMKKAVKALSLEIENVNVTVTEKEVELNFESWHLPSFQLTLRFTNLENLPVSAKIAEPMGYGSVGSQDIYKEPITFSNDSLKFTARDYLCHVLDVVNKSEITITDAGGADGVSRKAIRDLFNGVPILQLIYDSDKFPNNVLKYTSCHAKQAKITPGLQLGILPYAHQVLCSNFEHLDINTSSLNFNGLLNLNSSLVDLSYSRFTEKDFNLFLKHWILGLSNPDLKRLRTFKRVDDLESLLRGICFKQQPASRSRTVSYNLSCTWTYQGGCDVRRNDGTEATIYIDKPEYFTFVVWEKSEISEISEN